MKKTILRSLSIFLAIFLILGTIPIGVSAAETTSDFEYFVLDDGTIMLTSYIGDSVEVNIPEMIDGYTVTTINSNCFFYKKQIEKVVIPKTVEVLNNYDDQAYVFRGNWKIKEIVVAENNPYYSTDNGVLYNKSKTRLIFFPIASEETEFTIPLSVKEIGPGAFVYNLNLKSIKFLSELSYIGHDAFNYMNGISYFEYPKCNLDRMSGILNDCLGHIDVIISKDITAIKDLSFAGSNVTLYVYPDSYGLEWAKSHDFPYVIMEEPPVEKELVDENTGIQVSGVMDAEATLNVESVENTVENAISSFNITLVKDGNIIQPDGSITISIPSEYSECDVFWIKDDGTRVNMNAEYVDGKYVFTTDHLSIYALVRNNVPTVPEPTETIPIPTETVPEPTETDPVPTETLPEPTVTDPVPTETVPVTTGTDPINTEPPTTDPTTTSPVATPDTPSNGNNGSNASSSNTPSSNSNNTSNGAVATGDMFGIDNSILIALILAATTAMVIANKKRKNSYK